MKPVQLFLSQEKEKASGLMQTFVQSRQKKCFHLRAALKGLPQAYAHPRLERDLRVACTHLIPGLRLPDGLESPRLRVTQSFRS